MKDILSILYKMRVFSYKELAQAVDGKIKSVAGLLTRYRQQGLVIQIRRNTYCVADLASGLPVCDKYEIGSHLSDTACVSYHSALEFHGLAHQTFNEVYVKSQSRFRSFSFDDVGYTYCRQTNDVIGAFIPKSNPYVRVTDLEATLIDCFDRIDRAGGIEELLHCMESVFIVNEEKLINYLASYNKAFLYQKAGFLFEKIQRQANISTSFIDLCHKKGAGNVKWLTNNYESDTFNKKWHLYIPGELTIKSMDDELI